jgi:antitoxin (DNA-binding transcriptional repressor) of toxin-antitoxin stability system
MKSVGVKDLKAHLSKYLRLVKSGETVRVTEHNRVIAEIILPRESPVLSLLEKYLADGAECGKIQKALKEPTLPALSTDGASLEWQTILEDLRRDRF